MSSDLEHITNCARSNVQWEAVYQHILQNPQHFFLILPTRRWSIAHQTVLHGDVNRFKSFISLFSGDDIDIHFKTKDNLSFLDIAKSRENDHPEMYAYIERLYMQDELMKKAKESDWRSVIEILETRKELANEKPPYSPCFLLHYVIENGTTYLLEELIDNFKCFTNVRNDRNETPLEMAIRLRKDNMCSILKPKTASRQPTRPTLQSPEQLKTPVRPEELIKKQNPQKLADRFQYPPPTAKLPPQSCPNTESNLTPIGFENIINDLQQVNLLTNSATESSSESVESQTKTSNVNKRPRVLKTIISPCSPIDSDVESFSTPSSSSSFTVLESNPIVTTTNPPNQRLMGNLRCALNDQIMSDPVIATDGYTYERNAILDWINLHGCSPITGKPMDATFQDNVEVRRMLKSFQNQK